MAAEANLMNAGTRSGTIRRVALIAVEAVITVVALVVLFRGIDLPETARSFRKANYWLLAPAVVFLILDLQFRAVRWRLLLAPQAGLRHSNLFGATNVGYLVNDVLPFRAGEVARVFLIDELEKTGKVRSAASIAVERGIDVIAMVALVIATFPFIDEPGWTHGPALLIGAGAVAAFALLIALSHANETDRAFWKRWLRAVPRIGEHLEQASNTMLVALHPLRRAVTLGAVVALTATIWLCGTLSFLMVMKAFHLDVGFPAAAIVIGATTLGMVVPSSPGYVGVFHAIAVKTLTEVFGIPKETALTYAVAQHAVIYFVPAALGASFLLQHRSMWHDFASSIGLRARRTSTRAGERALLPESVES
jgi:uncharacterized protein (TIRG00374 family)